MAHLSVNLLGSFTVFLDGNPVVDFHYDKGRALLTLLALEPNWEHRRERIAGLLWPDVPEGQARRLLRTVLYRLRAAILDLDVDSPFILVTRDTLRLNPDAGVLVDAITFRALVSAVGTHAHEDLLACAGCAEQLSQAAALYEGDLLSDFSLDSAEFEGWLVTQREALHQDALEVLGQLAAYHLGHGAYDTALTYARRQIALEPWQEMAHRQAMQALVLSGQRAAALRQYQTCIQMLRTELGIEPEAATVGLFEQIRRGELQPEPPARHKDAPPLRDSPTRPVPAASSATQFSNLSPVLSSPSSSTAHPVNEPRLGGGSPIKGQSLPEGERRFASLVLAEIDGAEELLRSTGLEVWAETVHALLAALREEVARYGGIVIRTGDVGLVAAFGAEVAHEDDTERAVLAALGMAQAFETVRAGLAPDGAADALALRAGVTTGEAIVIARTATGVTLHASALAMAESLQAKAPPGSVWVTESTYRQVESRFEWAWLGEVLGPGCAPARLYRPVARVSTMTEHDVGGLRVPLVGRDSDLRALTDAVARVRAGIGGIVSVVGEAGIGKSRLVAEARAWIEASGPLDDQSAGAAAVRWIEGRWLSYSQDVAYYGWQELLRRLLDLPSDPAEGAYDALEDRLRALCPDRVGALAPYLARLLLIRLNAATAAPLDSLAAAGLLQDTIFRAVGDVVARAARKAPLVLVLEDLHWADEVSLALLEQLLALTDRMPLLLVVAYRPVRGHGCWRVRETMVRDYGHRLADVSLRPLSQRDNEALVRRLVVAGGGDVGRPGVDGVASRAEGNPFFTAELVRSLLDRPDAEGVQALPESIQRVLLARIDRLPVAARQVLQLASVVGRTFGHQILADLTAGTQAGASTGSQESSLDEALLALLRGQMIRESALSSGLKRGTAGERAYIFDHELTMEAAYGSMLQRKRRILHRRVAETLERLHPDQIEAQLGLLARHWEAAGDAGRAVDYLRRAAEQAADQYANDGAVDYFTRALQLVPETDQATQIRLLLAREAVYQLQGVPEARAGDLARLRELSANLGDPMSEAKVAVREARWANEWERDLPGRPEAAQLADQAVRLAQRAGDAASEAEALLCLSHALGQTHQSAVVVPHIERALGLARSANAVAMEVECLDRLAYAAQLDGQHARAVGLLLDALQRSRQMGDRAREIGLLTRLSWAAEDSADYDKAREYAEEAHRIAGEIGALAAFPDAGLRLCFAELSLGQWDSARRHVAAFLELASAVRTPRSRLDALMVHSLLCRGLGLYEEARVSAEEAADVLVERTDPMAPLWVWNNLARLDVLAGSPDKAEYYARRVIEAFPTGEVPHTHHSYRYWQVAASVSLGDSLQAQGRSEEAISSFRHALSSDARGESQVTCMEAQAGLVEVFFSRDQTQEALAEAAVLYDFLSTHRLEGGLEPLRIPLVCYRVLSACQDPRAVQALKIGYQELMRRAETIDDDALRRSYLENVVVNREIVAEYRRLGQPTT